MVLRKGIVLFALATIPITAIFAQQDDWRNLRPLQSNRVEVEQVIGKPRKYFETYGAYWEKPDVVFDAWFSSGNCRGGRRGVQYVVPAGLLTRLDVTFKKKVKLSDLGADASGLSRVKHDEKSDHVYYYSPNESVVYKTYVERDGSETVLSVSIQPGRDKEGLLCTLHKPDHLDRNL